LCLYELDDEQCVAYGTELSLQEWTLSWSSCVGLSFTYHSTRGHFENSVVEQSCIFHTFVCFYSALSFM
jgi:hypothetical protein